MFVVAWHPKRAGREPGGGGIRTGERKRQKRRKHQVRDKINKITGCPLSHPMSRPVPPKKQAKLPQMKRLLSVRESDLRHYTRFENQPDRLAARRLGCALAILSRNIHYSRSQTHPPSKKFFSPSLVAKTSRSLLFQLYRRHEHPTCKQHPRAYKKKCSPRPARPWPRRPLFVPTRTGPTPASRGPARGFKAI